MSFSLTPAQKVEYEKSKLDPRRQNQGMAKWVLKFESGQGAIMLTDEARTPAEAFMAAVEKFGKSFKEIA